MNVSKRITELREKSKMSRGNLAKRSGISENDLSDIEDGVREPRSDEIIALCKVFGISCDRFAERKNKYFGTDGYRGETNVTLTSDAAYKIGRFLGSRAKSVAVGKDTRLSGGMLEAALCAGLTSSGADVFLLGVIPTPAVAFITEKHGFDFGMAITASHNPFYDNGIKIFRGGKKLDDEETALIEEFLDGNAAIPFATRENIGKITDFTSGKADYAERLKSLAKAPFSLRVGLDCANGAAYRVAQEVFSSLCTEVFAVGKTPDGFNINLGCGSTHIENLRKLVTEKRLDVGIAFDGDGDRCIAVDENGKIFDGDFILYILAKRLLRKGKLKGNTVVTTVMSNSALLRALEDFGIKSEITAVGDRYVCEKIEERGFALGGEPSGHIILPEYFLSGDGAVTAITLLNEISETKKTLSELSDGLILFPQVTKNISVSERYAALSDAAIVRKINEINEKLGKSGRAFLRASGTEPLLRITVESKERERCDRYVSEILKTLCERGYLSEKK